MLRVLFLDCHSVILFLNRENIYITMLITEGFFTRGRILKRRAFLILTITDQPCKILYLVYFQICAYKLVSCNRVSGWKLLVTGGVQKFSFNWFSKVVQFQQVDEKNFQIKMNINLVKRNINKIHENIFLFISQACTFFKPKNNWTAKKFVVLHILYFILLSMCIL